MADLADLEKRRDQLLAAQANPAKSVQHGDKSLTNRSVAEIRMMVADVDKEIGRVSGRRKNRQIRIVTSRGF